MALPAEEKWDAPMGLSEVPNKPEELKRITRVLAIIQLVASQPNRWRRSGLADRFEVSERQIDKDVQVIRHGLILSLRHSADGYAFEHLPALAAAPLSFGESLALLLAAQAARSVAGIDSADLAAAVSRMETQFPVPVRHLLQRIARSDAADPAAQHRTHVLGVIERAIADQRKLRLTYASAAQGGAVSERVVRPYAVLQYVRSWHLIGYCERREDVRMFKVDRVRAIAPIDEAFAVPADFDVDAYFAGGWGILRDAQAPIERVDLLFNAEAGRWVGEERWHPQQRIESLPDGTVRFTVDVAVTPELVRWVLGYGGRVRVASPASLRDAVVGEAEAIVRAARGGGS